MAPGQVTFLGGALGPGVRLLAGVGPSPREQRRIQEELERKKEDIFTNAMMQMQMTQLQHQREAEVTRTVRTSETGRAMWGDFMKLAPWLLGGVALTIVALAAIRPARPAPVRRRPKKKKKAKKAKAKRRTSRRKRK